MMFDLLAQVDTTKTSFWLPPDLSVDGAPIDRLITVLHVFMAILFVGWGIFFVYCLVKFRHRPGHQAQYTDIKAKPSKYAEIAVIVFEVILLFGFSMPVWAEYRNKPPAEKDRLEVHVVAQQFAWNLHYPGPDGKFGPLDPKLIQSAGPNFIGVDRSQPDGADDLVIQNTMVVPVDKDVYVRLSSFDVIHSFALPLLRVKQDAVPGMQIPVWFRAKQKGEFDIQCAQLCGNNHYRMRGRLKIVDPAEYETWLSSQGTGEEVFEE